VLNLAKAVHGPEGQRKIAGGETSPRAGTTGLRPPQRMRPRGCAGEHGDTVPRTLLGASGLCVCSGGSIRRSLHHRLISAVPSGRQTSLQHIRSHSKTGFAKFDGSQEFTFLDSLSYSHPYSSFATAYIDTMVVVAERLKEGCSWADLPETRPRTWARWSGRSTRWCMPSTPSPWKILRWLKEAEVSSAVFVSTRDGRARMNPNGIPSFSPRVAEPARLPWVMRPKKVQP